MVKLKEKIPNYESLLTEYKEEFKKCREKSKKKFPAEHLLENGNPTEEWTSMIERQKEYKKKLLNTWLKGKKEKYYLTKKETEKLLKKLKSDNGEPTNSKLQWFLSFIIVVGLLWLIHIILNYISNGAYFPMPF
ncbi:MAG: hypothetical protein ACQEQC_01085 [Elusimicrobiota bacterium]